MFAGSLVENSRTNMPRTSRLLNARETWSCDQEFTWRELGETYYPRYVREVTCLNTTCMFGHYTCSPVYMNVKVLKLNNVGCLDLNIPYELRSSWLFEDIAVAVHCNCGRVQ
ncbi:hypothetical protein ACJMK2_004979 [Sinanodonta woodiana]|uniref:Uncharacterized protein n=1 Tax=Sinanodonta woodiana TaxID=1069815 RepID=A0ABD3VNT1_SINWO